MSSINKEEALKIRGLVKFIEQHYGSCRIVLPLESDCYYNVYVNNERIGTLYFTIMRNHIIKHPLDKLIKDFEYVYKLTLFNRRY